MNVAEVRSERWTAHLHHQYQLNETYYRRSDAVLVESVDSIDSIGSIDSIDSVNSVHTNWRSSWQARSV